MLFIQANWCNMTFIASSLFPSHTCIGWTESSPHHDLNPCPQHERRTTYQLSYPSPLQLISHVYICTYTCMCVYPYYTKTCLNIGIVSIHEYKCVSSVLITQGRFKWLTYTYPGQGYGRVPQMTGMSGTHAPHMHQTCTTHVSPMHHTCTTYVLHIHHTCITYAPHMQNICTTYAAHMYHICTTHAPYMHHTCTTHAPHMYHPCTTNAPHMHTYAPHVHHKCTTHAPCSYGQMEA